MAPLFRRFYCTSGAKKELENGIICAIARIPNGCWFFGSVIVACATYEEFKGEKFLVGNNSNLSLKIDTQTATLLTKLNDMEKEIENVGPHVETCVESLEKTHF